MTNLPLKLLHLITNALRFEIKKAQEQGLDAIYYQDFKTGNPESLVIEKAQTLLDSLHKEIDALEKIQNDAHINIRIDSSKELKRINLQLPGYKGIKPE